MKSVMNGAYFYNGESLNFNFYTDLSASEKITFVNSVVNTLVDDESYNSIVRNMIFDYMLVKVFTNVDTSDIDKEIDKEEESDESLAVIDKIENFLSETNIVDVIKANAEIGLIEELSHSVDLSIEYLTGIHKNPLGEALSSLVNTLESKIKEIDLSNAMKMAYKFAGITEELTPESIVNAYIDAKK